MLLGAVGAVLLLLVAISCGEAQESRDAIGVTKEPRVSDCPVVPLSRLDALIGPINRSPTPPGEVFQTAYGTQVSCLVSSDRGGFQLQATCASSKRADSLYSSLWRRAAAHHRVGAGTKPMRIEGIGRRAFQRVNVLAGVGTREAHVRTDTGVISISGNHGREPAPVGLVVSLARESARFACGL